MSVQHISEERVVGAVSIEKDVDGFHPMNVGRLAMQGRAPLFVACTPKGCIELLLRSGVEMEGKHAVVIGRSNVVGMPAALLLQVCRSLNPKRSNLLLSWLVRKLNLRSVLNMYKG